MLQTPVLESESFDYHFKSYEMLLVSIATYQMKIEKPLIYYKPYR